MTHKIRVLYVDDDAFMHEPFKMFLEMNSDMQVSAVSSAEEALEQMNGNSYDSIVSDYQMAGMDGIEFLKKVRGMKPELPFILFTGRGREEVVIQALNEGADHYIQKGGDPQSQFAQLAHMVRSSYEIRRQRKALVTLGSRLSSFMENTSDSIVVYEVDGTIQSVNGAFTRIYGWKQDEVTGKNPPHIPPEEVEKRDSILEQIFNTGESAHYVSRRVRRDGKAVDVNVSLSPIKDDSGGITGFVSIAKDVSDMVEVMDSITRVKEEFRVILGSIGDSVVSTDTEGKVTYLNSSAEKMLGFSLDEAVGHNVNDIVHIVNESNGETVEVPSEKVIIEGTTVHLGDHSVVRSADGAEHYVLDLASPLRKENGEIMGTVIVLRDVTREKISERTAAALHSVTRLMLNADANDGIMGRVMASVCSELHYDGAILWKAEEERKLLRLVSSHFAAGSTSSALSAMINASEFSWGYDLPGDVWNGAKTVLARSLEPSSDENLAAAAYADGFRSLFAYPVFDDHALVKGVMMLLNRKPSEPAPKTVSALMDIGSLIAGYLGRKKSTRTSDIVN